jgi:hypothetical protein
MLNVLKDIEEQVKTFKLTPKDKRPNEQRKLTMLINKAKGYTNNDVLA